MEKLGRSRSPMKGYQSMSHNQQQQYSKDAGFSSDRSTPPGGPPMGFVGADVSGGGGGIISGSVGGGVGVADGGAAAAAASAATSTAAHDGSGGGGVSGSGKRSGVSGNQGQQEVAQKLVDAGKHFIKDQLLPAGRQRQGVMAEPLLNTSQASLKDIRLAEASASGAAAAIPVSTSIAVRGANGAPEINGSGGAVAISYRRTAGADSVSFEHHAPPSHLHQERQTAACYSRDLSASNGDLSSPQPVVSKHSSSSRYQPMYHGGGGAGGAGSSSPGADAGYSMGTRGPHRLSSSSSRPGSVITFRNINYEVLVKRYPWSRAEKKVVLSNVSGIMRPGLNAIMGATGSGKSSLLDVLAGRKDPQYLRGEVLVDGAEQPDNFKCMSGYVVQDDIVMGTLTVRENLNFSAALRLPGNTSTYERKEKVETLIRELGLTKVAESKIGTELIRGVSGGERKRTNIGMELINDPPVLFLDEPTTGLDAFTAGSVIRTLKMLANSGRTIVFSIHQPKYSIYRLFDNLTLVVSGSVVYHGGAGDDPLKYFSSIGFHCEAHNSPPDFFLDMVHGEVASRKGSSDDLEAIEKRDSLIDTDMQKSHSEATSDRLVESWRSSRLCEMVDQRVEDDYQRSLRHEGTSAGVKMKKAIRINYSTSIWNQIVWVSWRTGLNLFRNPQSSVIQLIVYLFFGISIGTVFYDLDKSLESGIQNRQGLFFFLLLQMVYVNLGAVDVFIKERVIFIHESSSGFYRISVYFLAKIFCDMLPIKTLPVILFMPIVYFMAKLKLDAGAFFFYELNLVLATCGACAVAFFVSASVSVFGIANIIISIIYVFMMIFGGFLMNMGSMGSWLSWCKYLSVFYYGYTALSANEFVGMEFCPKSNTTNVTRTCMDGYTVLRDQQIDYKSAWDMWGNELGMLAITLVFLALCYVQLRRINRYK